MADAVKVHNAVRGQDQWQEYAVVCTWDGQVRGSSTPDVDKAARWAQDRNRVCHHCGSAEAHLVVNRQVTPWQLLSADASRQTS